MCCATTRQQERGDPRGGDTQHYYIRWVSPNFPLFFTILFMTDGSVKVRLACSSEAIYEENLPLLVGDRADNLFKGCMSFGIEFCNADGRLLTLVAHVVAQLFGYNRSPLCVPSPGLAVALSQSLLVMIPCSAASCSRGRGRSRKPLHLLHSDTQAC